MNENILHCGNNCATCGANRGSSPSCPCTLKFYDDGSSNPCISCHYSCSDCSNGSACNSCDDSKFRTSSSLSSFCVCKNKYYDNGV